METPFISDRDHVPGGPVVTTLTLPPAQPKKRRLNRMGDIRGALADVCRKLESGDMEAKTATALISALDTLGRYIKERELEIMAARVQALKERQAEGKAPLAAVPAP